MTKLKKIVAYTSIVAGVVAIFCAFVSSIHITYFIFSTGSFSLEFQFKKCFHFQFLSEGASNSKHPPTTADPSFTIISDTDKILAGIFIYVLKGKMYNGFQKATFLYMRGRILTIFIDCIDCIIRIDI